jgi:hypothetical protein
MLGVLELQRLNAQPKKAPTRSGRPRRADDEECRWYAGVRSVESSLGQDVEAIHLMDRASDSFELWARMTESNCKFVSRVSKNRKIDSACQVVRPSRKARRPVCTARANRPTVSARKGTRQWATQNPPPTGPPHGETGDSSLSRDGSET